MSSFVDLVRNFWECEQGPEDSVRDFFVKLRQEYYRMKNYDMAVSELWDDNWKLTIQFVSGLRVKAIFEALNDWFIENSIPEITADLTIYKALAMAEALEKNHEDLTSNGIPEFSDMEETPSDGIPDFSDVEDLNE